jgi:hypothetical protein
LSLFQSPDEMIKDGSHNTLPGVILDKDGSFECMGGLEASDLRNFPYKLPPAEMDEEE